ncbi:MAG: hypothetical protein ABJG15_18315 [Hyphomonadaceae bacterium]
MIWLVWVFGFFTVLGASQIARAKGRGDRAVIAILIAGFLASLGYLFIGRAGLPDQPYQARIAKLEAIPPEQRSRAEVLAQFESLIREQPDNPRPHFVIGEMMAGQGRNDDAIRAFQSALRRDERFVPAMIGMADAITRSAQGRVGPQAKRIYERALTIDPAQLHAGFMYGVGTWQDGDDEAARLVWDGLWLRLDGNREQQVALEERVTALTDGAIVLKGAGRPDPDTEPADEDSLVELVETPSEGR